MSDAALIVDDSLTVRMDLKEAFEGAGFDVHLSSTLAEARLVLGRSAVAVLVLDVVLPDGDGVELLAEIRGAAATAAVPVLLLSSEAEVHDRVRGLTRGADEYVGKPYDRAYVTGRAKELLRSRQGGVARQADLPVLVVDDSVTFREQLREALVGAGYAVAVAATGEEGLRVAADRRPMAIVVDGVMPGIDGATFIRYVRLDGALRSTPCILLTGSEGTGAELRALDAGADAFVRKDEPIDVILARLAAVLRRTKAGVTTDTARSLLAPKRILAVDDSPTYLQALAETLRQDGYDVVLARSGEEALELVAVQTVDCILLDVMMPGLSGQDTCRRIKAAPGIRDVPLLMLTALEGRDAMIEGLSVGADDYISKSSEFEILKARVRAQVRRKQFEDEHRHVREELLRREVETTEARAARDLAETRAALVDELERANRELEAFSYSVSHDLRAPLRGIDGYSRILEETFSGILNEEGKTYLARIRGATAHMGQLIDDLLGLARVTRSEMVRANVDLTRLVRGALERLQAGAPERVAHFSIEDGVTVYGDERLLAVLVENLLGNAWKFTSKRSRAEIAFGRHERGGVTAYFVRDNGAGFDMAFVDKLFGAFQRLHAASDFDGTGIGLATVQRIAHRHGGQVWAEASVDAGATFSFTLGSGRAASKDWRS